MFYTFLSGPPLLLLALSAPCEKSKSQKLNPIMPARGAHSTHIEEPDPHSRTATFWNISSCVSVLCSVRYFFFFFHSVQFFLESFLFHIPTQVPQPETQPDPNRACAHSIIMIRWLLITKFIYICVGYAPAFSCSFSPKSRNQGIWKTEKRNRENWRLSWAEPNWWWVMRVYNYGSCHSPSQTLQFSV